MNWTTDAERLALLAEMLKEQQMITPPPAPPPKPAPYYPVNKRFYQHIRYGPDGRIVPKSQTRRPSPDSAPPDPIDKTPHPRREKKPIGPTAASMAIARYLERTDPRKKRR